MMSLSHLNLKPRPDTYRLCGLGQVSQPFRTLVNQALNQPYLLTLEIMCINEVSFVKHPARMREGREEALSRGGNVCRSP